MNAQANLSCNRLIMYHIVNECIFKDLITAVPFIIWMRQSSNAMICRNDRESVEGTTGVCDLGIYFVSDMVNDHIMT